MNDFAMLKHILFIVFCVIGISYALFIVFLMLFTVYKTIKEKVRCKKKTFLKN